MLYNFLTIKVSNSLLTDIKDKFCDNVDHRSLLNCKIVKIDLHHLFQANLDKDPSEMAISPRVFAILKQANQSRFEILRDLYSKMGMDVSQGRLPDLTPCVLLSVHEVRRGARPSLLTCLHIHYAILWLVLFPPCSKNYCVQKNTIHIHTYWL